jgi:hypothetical protein
VVPALYIAIMTLVAANTFWKQPYEAWIGVGFIVAGAVVYLVALRRSTAGQS